MLTANDDARIGAVLRHHMRGLSQRDVAQAIGASQRYVCNVLKRLRIEPNGYKTGASKRKRAKAVREVYQLKRSLAPVDPPWEAEWPLTQGAIPARLGYHAFAALSRREAIGHGEAGIQLLPRGDHLLVRAADTRLIAVIAAIPEGTTLVLGGDVCRLGTPTVRQVRDSSRLGSWCVTAKGKRERADFEAWCRRDLDRLGVTARLAVGERRVIKIKGRVIVGYQVTLTRLHRLESLRLQAVGLGGRRRFGCGVFVPC
jgi:CRISPR-associated protein Cas6